MTKFILAAIATLPLLAAPALAITETPKVKAPVADCTGTTTADCATVIQVGWARRG